MPNDHGFVVVFYLPTLVPVFRVVVVFLRLLQFEVFVGLLYVLSMYSLKFLLVFFMFCQYYIFNTGDYIILE